MHWRRFKISEIPLDNDEAFSRWLKNRWTEKDYLLEHFYRHGSFPAGDPIKAMQAEAAVQKVANGNGDATKKQVIKPVNQTAKFITTEVKAGGWEEFLSIFAPITAAATALSSGDLAPENIDFDALLNKVAQQQQMNLLNAGKAPKAPKSTEEMRQALTHASKAAGGPPIKRPVIETITRNAAKTQREIQEAMAKHPLPDAPRNPTAGRKLDPGVQRSIDEVHEETRRRLMRASQPASKGAAPNVRKNIPLTPVETAITRPLSTIAMQRARQGVQKAAENKQKQKDVPKVNGVVKPASTAAGKQPAKTPAAVKEKVQNASSSSKAPQKAAVKSASTNPKKL